MKYFVLIFLFNCAHQEVAYQECASSDGIYRWSTDCSRLMDAGTF